MGITIANWKISTRDKQGKLIEFHKGQELKGIDKKELRHLIDIGGAHEVQGAIEVENQEKDGNSDTDVVVDKKK